ncbi:MAG: cardiolipin synthase [Clostridia bacterium]|nr:cardiolipin synthase [Clostridia bacterium]
MRVKRLRETGLGYRVLKLLRRRVVIVTLAILVQLAVLTFGLAVFSRYYAAFYGVGVAISVATALYVINSRSNPEFKVAWLVPILLLPYFGGIIYILFGGSRFTRKSRQQIEHDEALLKRSFGPEYRAMAKVTAPYGAAVAGQSRCLLALGGYPAFGHTDTRFFPTGEAMWLRMLEELEKAERYILMEYFIIGEGEMWGRLLEVLERKAAQGVDVRLIYDDIGCIMLLPVSYPKTLREKGIQTCVFNPFMPVLTSGVNNRDHRKICVIDGHTAFTGGANLADEYIDRIRRFGYWKDTGLMMHGDAAWGFAVMFLDLWDALQHRQENLNDFRPDPAKLADVRGQGLVQPFCSAPFSRVSISETAITGLIRRATRYVYITTPYLIPTHELIMALTAAARSGVDVRIITPNIPDKKAVFAATRAHYMQLVEAGVKVYEYSPGFIHAKQIVADDHCAMVGSVNLDFRSLYLNFECAAWMVDAECIPAIRTDMEEIMRVSERITMEKCRRLEGNVFQRLWRSVLRLFAPLM